MFAEAEKNSPWGYEEFEPQDVSCTQTAGQSNLDDDRLPNKKQTCTAYKSRQRGYQR